MKPTIYLDASALKESSCDRRLLNTVYYGFQPRGDTRHQNYKAGYGSAVHKALEYWYKSEQPTVDKAIQIALDFYEPYSGYIPANNVREYRTPLHLAQALKAYFTYYNGGMESFNVVKGLLESKFTIPWFSCDEFDLVLTGTIDMLATYYGEEVFVDHKSTGAYEIEEYMHSYQLSVQMMFYCWVIRRLTGRLMPCVINGIFLKKPTAKSETFDGVKFQRSQPIRYTEAQLNKFELWLYHKIDVLSSQIKEAISSEMDGTLYLPFPNFAACQGGKFGLCPYYNACSLDIKDQEQSFKSMERVHYNPLTFGEE